MRVLLDECVDRRLARYLEGHSVTTVPKMGWAGVKNGKLLALAQEELAALVTMDKNLSYQQPLLEFKIAVVVVKAPSNRLADLLPLVPDILAALASAKPGQAMLVPNE